MAETRSGAARDRWFPAAAIAVALVSVGYLAWMLTTLGGQLATTWFDDIGELVAAWIAAACCIHVARRTPDRGRRAWFLMAGWAFVWGLGEAVWCWYELIQKTQTPFPSLADAGYLGAIPFAVLAALSFPAAVARGRARLRLVLDGLTIAAALLSVSWATVLGHVYAYNNDSSLATFLSLAYPISDVVVGTMLLVLVIRSRRGAQPALLLLTLGMAMTAVADSAFAYLTADGTYASGSWVDTGWVAGFLLVALAALRARRRPVHAVTDGTPGRSRLLLPYVPVAVALVLAVDEEFGSGRLGHFLFITMLVLVVVVVGRQVLTLSDNVDLIRRLSDRERQLDHQAHHDSLTGLANRVRFRECVSRALAAHGGRRTSTSVAVMFVDLDDFKDVNDRFGHQVGDLLLIAVADRLRSCLRSNDVPARLGGDEFAVLVEARTPQELLGIADRILEALRAPVQLPTDTEVHTQGTIGVAIAEGADIGTDELLRRADVAMYAAKARGKGVTGLFEPSLEEALRDRDLLAAVG